jgi:hypothetical protein
MTANVNPQNIVQGPANLWLATFGATEPVDSAVATDPSSPWVFAGGTETPVVLEEDLTYTNQRVTQIQMPLGARITDYAITVKTMMSEANVANLQWALNQLNTVVVSSGYTTGDRQVGVASSQPSYSALIVDGWGPLLNTGASARWRHIVRKVISQPKIVRNYDPTKQVGYDVTFTAFFVSSSISPLHEVLQTA